MLALKDYEKNQERLNNLPETEKVLSAKEIWGKWRSQERELGTIIKSPKRLRIGKISKDIAFEIFETDGIINPKVFGVFFIKYTPNEIVSLFNESRTFPSLFQVNMYVDGFKSAF